ncbi:MAG: hypothetical protein EHM28_13665, partial [Spirochaetaceae bacterium]
MAIKERSKKQFTDYFLHSYMDLPMEIQKKIKGLVIAAIVNMFFLIGAFFLVITKPALTPTEVFVGSAANITGIILLALILFLVRVHRHKAAVYIYLNAIVLIVFAIIFFQNESAIEYYKYVAGLFSGLCIVSLISLTKRQLLSYIFISGSSMPVFMLVFCAYRGLGVDGTVIRDLATGLTFYSLGSLILFFLSGIVEERIQIIVQESKKNQQRLTRINNMIESSKDGLAIGEKLITASGHTMQQFETIWSNLTSIQSEIKELYDESKTSLASNQEIVKSSGVVKNGIEDYNAIISEVSASIEEMTAAIHSVSDISTSRKSVMDHLLSTSQEAQEKVQTASQVIEGIGEKANSVFEIINMIKQVSGQTNLLALNAAIEAAHAGDAGRGFAVVAEEIRRLAEQTDLNLKLITGNLKTYFDEVNQSISTNREITQTFAKISQEIDSVAHAMDEITQAMSEMSGGTREILSGVTNIVGGSQKIGDSIG